MEHTNKETNKEANHMKEEVSKAEINDKLLDSKPYFPDSCQYCVWFIGWRATHIIAIENALYWPSTSLQKLVSYKQILLELRIQLYCDIHKDHYYHKRRVRAINSET